MADVTRKPRNRKRARQTNRIYIALGRYVEAFEQMVGAIRGGCIVLTSFLAAKGKGGRQQDLMRIVFNHKTMSAEPLFRIYQSIVGGIINDKNTPFEDNDLVAIRGVLKQFDTRFQTVVNTRNDYLHGTWLIDRDHEPTEDWSKILFAKAKTTSQGLKYVDGPKSARDVVKLTTDCQNLNEFFLRFHLSFMSTLFRRSSTVADAFELVNKEWKAKPPAI